MKRVERFLFPRLSPPGDRGRDVLGFVPAVSVSSSSTLQIFRDASHSWWLLCPHLLGRFEEEKTDTTLFSSKKQPQAAQLATAVAARTLISCTFPHTAVHSLSVLPQTAMSKLQTTILTPSSHRRPHTIFTPASSDYTHTTSPLSHHFHTAILTPFSRYCADATLRPSSQH